jgi:hypothetical protein
LEDKEVSHIQSHPAVELYKLSRASYVVSDTIPIQLSEDATDSM